LQHLRWKSGLYRRPSNASPIFFPAIIIHSHHNLPDRPIMSFAAGFAGEIRLLTAQQHLIFHTFCLNLTYFFLSNSRIFPALKILYNLIE